MLSFICVIVPFFMSGAALCVYAFLLNEHEIDVRYVSVVRIKK